MNHPALAIIAFNRPKKIEALLSSLSGHQFRAVYLIIDGPRQNTQDNILCSECIDLLRAYEWGCPVKENIAKKNLGCGLRVSSGISWAFTFEEDLIILEDDIIPDKTFFQYATKLLDKYRLNPKVMHISGCNPISKLICNTHSYYFSRYPHIWGWATWKRAWETYDFNLTNWPQIKSKLAIHTLNRNTARNWSLKLDRVYSGKLDTWDYQWLMAILINDGLSIIPAVNLIHNSGFDDDATHPIPHLINHRFSMLVSEKLKFPMSHPPSVVPDNRNDKIFEKQLDWYPIYYIKDFIYHNMLNK